VLKMLETFLPQNKGTAVLHWFTGSASEAKRAAQLGCYFSVNLEMLKSEQRRNLVASLPRERLLTETDGPFTTIDGRPTLPSDVISTLNALRTVLKMDLEAVKSQIRLNLEGLEEEKA
jgi:TatD DNase family protein